MLLLDSVATLALGIDDVCALDASRVSNPDSFRRFAGGIRMEPDFLLNDRWAQMPAMKLPSVIYGAIMQQMVPLCYDASWLENMGGSFSVRITGVGDYTLIVMNRRVVTLPGLPIDSPTNEPVVDLEIAPEVILSFCRGLLLDIADDVLSEDENEEREVSAAELLFNGMPSGGYVPREATDFAGNFAAARAGAAGMVAIDSASSGTISSSGDRDWFAVALHAGITYRIDLRGAASGRGTLADPYLYGMFNSNGAQVVGVNNDANGTLESQLVFTPTNSGIYYVSAGANGSNTGTYVISVVNKANASPLLPTVETGGDFGATITAARNEQIGGLSVNGVAQGTISFAGDKDWYAVSLEAGVAYRIDLRGSETGHGTLSDPYLWAIYSSDPNPMDAYGNIKADGVGRLLNDNYGVTTNSMMVFTPKKAGTYYISASGNGNSTGTYQLSVINVANAAMLMSSVERGKDFGSELDAIRNENIGMVSVNGVAQGFIGGVGDKDWWAVSLQAGVNYRIDLRGADSGRGTLADPYLFAIYDIVRNPYDINGNIKADGVGRAFDDNGSGSRDALIARFTPKVSGTYYISAAGAGVSMGTYQLSVSTDPNG